jgi:hypothetical protein
MGANRPTKRPKRQWIGLLQVCGKSPKDIVALSSPSNLRDQRPMEGSWLVESCCEAGEVRITARQIGFDSDHK